jgi:hypothetical protein
VVSAPVFELGRIHDFRTPALLAATALKAGPYALAVRLLAGCATGHAWTSDERLGAAQRVLNRKILRSGGASGE